MPRFQSDYISGKLNLPQPYDALVTKIPLKFVMPAVLAVNDILSLIRLPPGVRLVDYDIIAPQLDSNGTPTLAHSIGQENAGGTDLSVVFEAGLTFGRTANGSISRCAVSIPQLDVNVATERTISLKTTTAAATAALAGKTIWVLLHMVN